MNEFFIVTGNPRSATKSHAKCLKQCGVNVGHEEVLSDGTVSCFYFVDRVWYPNGRHSGDHFEDDLTLAETVYHLVRDPLDCIPSMVKIVGTDHQRWATELELIPEGCGSKLEKMMWMWYNTNVRIQTFSNVQVLQSEKLRENVSTLLRIPINEVPEIHTNKSSGNRRSERIDWGQLAACNSLLREMIEEQYKSLIDKAIV